MAESQNHDERAQFVCGLWLHTGFVGATALAAGLLQLLAGETTWYSSLALAFFGGVLAAVSWHRGQLVVEQADKVAAAADDAANEQEEARPRCYPPIPVVANRRINDGHGYPTSE
jgi:cyanate permease